LTTISTGYFFDSRWLREGNLKTGNCILFYNSKPGNQSGIEFIVNDRISYKIKKFREVDDRIYYIKIEYLCFNIVLINEYAPTEDEMKRKSKVYLMKV